MPLKHCFPKNLSRRCTDVDKNLCCIFALCCTWLFLLLKYQRSIIDDWKSWKSHSPSWVYSPTVLRRRQIVLKWSEEEFCLLVHQLFKLVFKTNPPRKMSKKTSKQIFHTIFATCPTLTSSSEDSSESDAFSCWDGWRAKAILERSGCSGGLWLKTSSSGAQEQWLLSKHVWHPDGKCLFFCGFWTSNLFLETNHDRTTQKCKSRLKQPCHNFRLIHRVKLWQGKQTSSKSWKSEVPSYVVTGIARMGLLAVQLLIFMVDLHNLHPVTRDHFSSKLDKHTRPMPPFILFPSWCEFTPHHFQTRSLILSIRLGPAKHTLVNPNPKESDWVTTVWNNPSWTSLHGRPVPFMCTKHLSKFCTVPWQTAYSTQQLLERKEILTSSSCSTKWEDILEWVPFPVWWTVYFNRACQQRCTTSSRSIFDLEGCLMLLDSSQNSPMQVQVTTVARTTSPAHRWCQTLSPTFLIQADSWLGGPDCCLKKSGQDMFCGTKGPI